MSIFSKLFSDGAGGLITSLGDLIDRFTLSKEEKQQFKLEVQSQLLQAEQELEETYRAELEARTAVIKAEMAQGDKYTKRARPSIIYGGLICIFLVHVLLPTIAYIAGAGNNMPDIDLPQEFWWAWGTVVSVYGAGRTAEKMGVINKFTQAATGSGANKMDGNKSVG